MKRILVIGGTGMLRLVTEYFISNNFHVSVVARDIEKLKYFTNKYPFIKTIDLISHDYSDADNFIKTIENKIDEHGSFDIIIGWIHSHAVHSLTRLINVLEKYNNQTILYHIKGSEYYDPTKRGYFQKININHKLDYREIFLGFKIENNCSRWLTDTEISNGVINAVESGIKKAIVGNIEPWELRP